MSLWNKVSNGLEMAKLCASAIEVVRDIVKRKPANAMELIETMVDAVVEALDDKRPIAEVRTGILELKAALTMQDASADAAGNAALDAKFPR